MAFWNKNKAPQTSAATSDATTSAATVAQNLPASFTKPDLPAVPTKSSGVVLTKGGGLVSLAKAVAYTIIARWTNKDYDLLALVTYTDGTTEWVSTFGISDSPEEFSTTSRDGSVVHASGDKATTDDGGEEQPFEVIKIFIKPNSTIKRVVLVTYSAQNSGAGSFKEYGVSTYVLPGDYDEIPDEQTIANIGGKVVLAENASDDPFVYTFVPAVFRIDNGDAKIDPVELYSEGGEYRPDYDTKTDKVLMDEGPMNAYKERPGE